MFKIATCIGSRDFAQARDLLSKIYDENPRHWPHGLDPHGFDGGLYLIREKQSNVAVGFTGWQVRHDRDQDGSIYKVGYYSIGVLPEYRGNGYAREAVAKLISEKAATVDKVRAMIVEGNEPSIGLARSLEVPVILKRAHMNFPPAWHTQARSTYSHFRALLGRRL